MSWVHSALFIRSLDSAGRHVRSRPMESGDGTAFRIRMLPWYRSCIRWKAAHHADSDDPAPRGPQEAVSASWGGAPRRLPLLRFSNRFLPNPSLPSGFFFPAPIDMFSSSEPKKNHPAQHG